MTKIRFTKIHGLGNDYIYLSLIPKDANRVELSDVDLKCLIVRLCRRRFGIGSDGVILIMPSAECNFKMRIFNPDGSEAEMCGNGIRGLGKYVYDRGLVDSDLVRIETMAGPRSVQVIETDGKKAVLLRVDMGEPILESRRIPVKSRKKRVVDEPFKINSNELRLTCVSMGNPHAVLFVDKSDETITRSGYQMAISTSIVSDLGSRIERLAIFPNRTNVQFVRILGKDEIEVRTWERGAGETLACGTGACAALVAGVLNGLCGRSAKIHLVGGDLAVEWAGNNHLYLSGPSEEVFQGWITLEDVQTS